MAKQNKAHKSKPVTKTKNVIPATKNNYAIYILLGAVMAFVALVRIRLLSIPLERDEGEYAYMGQLILQGIPPYQDAYNMKFPGTYLMYALIMSVFGQTTEGIHAGLLLVNLATILFIFFLTRRLIGNYAAIIASASFALITLSSSVLGLAGHATHFVILPALGGLWLLHKGMEEDNRNYIFLSGLLLGLAPVMKQPGIFFCLSGGLYLILSYLFYGRNESFKKFSIKLLLFSAGVILPLSLMLLTLKSLGVFDKFWFWTVEYAADYANQVQLGDAFTKFIERFSKVANGFYIFWMLGGLGVIVLLTRLKAEKKLPLFILLLFFFSFISICPGFYFRGHYFITLLPALVISYSFLLNYLLKIADEKKGFYLLKYVSYGLFAISMLIGLASQKDILFSLEPVEISRKLYTRNPFPESVVIGKYIKDNSGKEDKIAVLGSEPELLFYSGRRSATGYLYTYSLMEIHKNSLKMQKEMAAEIEAASPRFLVYVRLSASWTAQPESDKFIFDWQRDYLRKNKYELKGIAYVSMKQTIYKWGKEALNYKTPPDISIYEKKKETI